MSKCEILPLSGFQSTNLNSKIDTFQRLGDRIMRSLGFPSVNVEIHSDQLFENISIAVEFFTKYAGYTKEYLIFDSNMYIKDYGLKLDELFTFNEKAALQDQKDLKTRNLDFTKHIETGETLFISMSSIPGNVFTTSPTLSAVFEEGIVQNEIYNEETFQEIISFDSSLEGLFKRNVKRNISTKGVKQEPAATKFVNSFDYDVMDYRKVIAVTDFEEGSTTGINTLFTIEQTLAQQTYFSYAMGNYGFDLISWYTLKEWMENREKLLAIKRTYEFDNRTQILRMYPQPRAGAQSSQRFYGVISCYVERPIRDIIKEMWVYQYSLALTKIILGRVRGKYTGTSLFGGGQLNTNMLQEGLTEKDKLEQMLFTGAAPGMGDANPPLFFVA